MKALVTDCDLYAADPNDPQRAGARCQQRACQCSRCAARLRLCLAADINNPRLQFQFGRVLEIARRYDWAEHFYELAGKQQYSAALVNLGYMARVGMGREVDYDRAFDFYMQAAAMGNLRARTNIGTAYIRGQGVPELPEEGILWYRLAASSGWANAMTALGDSYSKGVGVEKDEVEAAKLYAAAADMGQIDAMSNLGRAYIGGSGVEKDVKRGLELLLKATDMGNQYAPRFAAPVLPERRRRGRPRCRSGRSACSNFPRGAASKTPISILPKATRDGSFRQGGLAASLPQRLAWRNGFKVEKAGELKEEIGKKLKPDIRQKIEADAELFIEQNGK